MLLDEQTPQLMLEEAQYPDYGAQALAPVGRSTMARGLRAGMLTDEAGGYAMERLKAEAAGDLPRAAQLKVLEDQALAEAGRWSPRAPSLRDAVTPEDYARWAQAGFGQGVGSTIKPAGGALAGAAAFGLMRGRFPSAPLPSAGTAAFAGASVPAYDMETNEAALNAANDPAVRAMNTPQQIVDVARAKGAVNAGLEAAVPALAVRALAPGLRTLRGATPAGTAARTLGAGMGGEALTETVQEGVGLAAQSHLNPERDTSGDAWQLAEAAALGGMVGGGMAAPGAATSAAYHALDKGVETGRRGAQAAKEKAPAIVDALQRGAEFVKENTPAAKDKALGALDRVLLKNRGEGLEYLASPQAGTPEELRADDLRRNEEATRLAQEVQASVDRVPQSVRDAAERYMAGPRTLDSWREFADTLRSWQRAESVKEAVTDFADSMKAAYKSERVKKATDAVLNATDSVLGKGERQNAQTPQADEFDWLLADALFPYTGLTHADQIVEQMPQITRLMRQWIESGFRQDEHGNVFVPKGLDRIFDDPALATKAAADLMVREGYADQEMIAPLLQQVIGELNVRREADKGAAALVGEYLKPTAAAKYGITEKNYAELAAAVKTMLADGKLDDARLDELFRDKERLLEALRRQMGHAQLLTDGEEREAKLLSDEHDENAAPRDDVEGMTNAVRPNVVEERTAWHFYSPDGRPWRAGAMRRDKEGKELGTYDSHADARAEQLGMRNNSQVRRVGYIDYLRETLADDKEKFADAVLAFIQAHQGELSANERARPDKALNKMYFVLRETRRSDAEQMIDIPPSEFKTITPDGRDNKWAVSVGRIDRKTGKSEYGLPEHGKLWFERADGARFATSTARIISRMRQAKKAGELEGSENSAVDQLIMLTAGISSMLNSQDAEGNYALKGKVGVMREDGKIVLLGVKDLPDSLALFGGVTLGQARKELHKEYVERAKNDIKRAIEEGGGDLSESDALIKDALKSGDERRILLAYNKLQARREKEGAWSASRTSTTKRGKDGILYASGSTTVDSSNLRVRRSKNYETGNEVVTLSPVNEAAGPIGERTVQSVTQMEKTKTGFTMRDVDGNQLRGPVYQMSEKPVGGRHNHHGISEVDEMLFEAARKEKNRVPRRDEHGMEVQEEGSGRLATGLPDEARKPGPVESGKAAPYKERQKREAVPAEEQVTYLLNLLRRGIPAFSDALKKMSDAQKAAVKALLTLMEAAKSPDAPLWRGKPPADMEAFGKRARVALLRLDGVEAAKEGEWDENAGFMKKEEKTQVREAKSGAPGSKENPHRVPMYYHMAPGEIRKELRSKYPKGTTTAQLIQDGHRTATTRRPPQGVLPSHYVVFDGVKGLYRVTGFEKIDLNSTAGKEQWSKREGWDTDAAMQRWPGQVKHGAIQMVFERVEGQNAEAIVDVSSAPAFARAKEAAKAAGADYVMAAEGVVGSYASRIAAQARAKGKLLTAENINEVKAGDVVYVSVPGASRPFTMKGSIYGLVPALLDRGAVVRTDTNERAHSAHNRTGEGVIYDRLKALGYEVTETQHYAEWKRPAKLSAQHAVDAEPLSAEEQQKIRDDVVRRLGPEIRTEFEKSLGGLSGDWTEGLIRVALNAVSPGQVAAHESMHELFSRLLKSNKPDAQRVKDILLRAANSAPVVNQIRLKLLGHPAALEQIADGAPHAAEERLAYAFQFWQAGQLNLGPQTESVFQKILNVLRKIVGLLSDEQKAERLFEAFEAGGLQTADAAIEVLNSQVEYREQRIKEAVELMRPVAERVDRAFGSVGERLHRSSNPHIARIGRLMKTPTGEGGAESFMAAKDREFKKWSNRLLNIFEGYSKEELAAAAPYLHGTKKSGDARIDGLVEKIKGKDGLLPAFEKYLRDSGLGVWNEEARVWDGMGHRENYFPRAYDVTKIMERSSEFIERLMKRHPGELRAILDKAKKEIADARDAGELTASKTASIDVLFGRYKSAEEALEKLTIEDVATAITARIVNSYGQLDLDETTASVGFSPYMRAINRRTLGWLDMDEFAEFMSDDVADILTTYLAQGVKRAEYVRRFGNGGERLQADLHSAKDWELDASVEKKYGVKGASERVKRQIRAVKALGGKTTFEQELAKLINSVDQKAGVTAKQAAELVDESVLKMKGVATDIMALEGTLGYDIDPRLRRIENSLMVYENMRTLGLALFSQFIDPLGIVVRGGELRDAWEAYKRGLREVWASWKGSHVKDEQSAIAELVGTADAHAMLSTFGQTYSSLFMGGKFRKANDLLFRINGMEGFNRGMQIGATTAAIGFIKRHVQRPEKNSTEYLAELNLKPEDVKIDKDGNLDYTDPKIQTAIHRWVDGAILRPNAAQRPAWASDPHWMIFWHMKQFAYTFHDVILRRVKHDALKYGEVGPAATLALGYVPVMVAADAAKALLLTGEEPAWMRAGLDGMVKHGVMRAGLFGAPQAFGEPLVTPRSVLSVAGPTVEHLSTIFEANPLPGASVMSAMGGYK